MPGPDLTHGPHLIYFADPMCSWCYGFAPVIDAITRRFGADLPIRLVLGGLRPGTTAAMDAATRAAIRVHWQHVQEASGQPFDHAFFDRPEFIYDTEPACRAVVVLRRHGMAAALAALHAVQSAFYAANRDVTQAATLAEIAAAQGVPAAAFLADFAAPAAQEETRRDFAFSQGAGVTGFPTLLAGTGAGDAYAMVTEGFRPADRLLPALERWRAAPG